MSFRAAVLERFSSVFRSFLPSGATDGVEILAWKTEKYGLL